MDYIGRYKNQKADSYWDSGLVNRVKTYEQNVNHNQFFYIYGKKRMHISFIYFSGSTYILVDGEEEKNPLFSLNVVADKIIQYIHDNETRVLKFLEALSCNGKAAKVIETKKETI